MSQVPVVELGKTEQTQSESATERLALDRPLEIVEGYPKRASVPDVYRSWSRDFQQYAAVWHESPRLAACDRTRVSGGWADPAEVSKEEFLLWSKTGYMHSYEGPIQHDPETGRPLNPLGRTGISGRGALGKWGPNHAADSIVTRISPDSGLLEVILVQRQDGQWAIPGGFLDPGESPLDAARRELQEEASVEVASACAWLVYQGVGDGPRTTDNAWVETSAYHFHCKVDDPVATAVPHGASDALQATWRVLTPTLVDSLYANHGELLRMALSQYMLRAQDLTPQIRAQISEMAHAPLLTNWVEVRGRVGILGGTFDPVHEAHLELAKKIMQERDLDAIVFIPNGHNPLKPHGPVASPRERVDMLQYALRDEPRMFVSPMESRIPGKSYTIDTLDAIRAQVDPKECSLCLIMGTDALRGLPEWKEGTRLATEAHIIPIQRAGETNPLEEPETLKHLCEAFGEEFISRMQDNLVPSLAAPLSASQIRSRMSEGRNVAGFLPQAVLEYIKRRGLYQGVEEASLPRELSP